MDTASATADTLHLAATSGDGDGAVRTMREARATAYSEESDIEYAHVPDEALDAAYKPLPGAHAGQSRVERVESKEDGT